MIVQGQTGYVVGADGSRNNLRQGRTGELIIGQSHADYNEPTSRGSVFNLTMNAAVGGVVAGNLVGAAANAATQFAIWNPVGSGVNMSILKVFIGIVSGTIVGGPVFHGVFDKGNPTNASTFDSTKGPQNCLIGGRQTTMRVINTATTGTTITGGTAPQLHRPMTMSFSAGTYAALAGTNALEYVDGDIVIPPGYGWIPLFAAAGTSVLWSCGCTWEEIPI
jgi:hypothetical protein